MEKYLFRLSLFAGILILFIHNGCYGRLSAGTKSLVPSSSVTVVPESIDFGVVVLGECVAEEFLLFISDVESTIEIVAPEGFGIALHPSDEFNDTLLIDHDQPSFVTSAFVRFCPVVQQDYQGYVSIDAQEIETVLLEVSGSVTDQGFSVSLEADPPEAAHTLMGEGTYSPGYLVTVSTSSEVGWIFENWTENGVILHEEIVYSFEIYSDRHLIANFVRDIPDLMVVPDSLDFGEVDTGSCDTLNYVLRTHWEEKQFFDIEIIAPEGFQVKIHDEEFTDTLYFQYYGGSGFGETLLVRFCPAEAREYRDSISHSYPGAETVYLRVRGTGKNNYQEYSVTLESDPPGAASELTGQGTYMQGQEVEVTASAMQGWIFEHWSENGEFISEDSVYNFIISSDRHLVAHFYEEEIYNLVLHVEPQGAGSVEGQGSYVGGQQVDISATASQDNSFWQWEGDIWVLDNVYDSLASFVMPSQDIELTAVFEVHTGVNTRRENEAIIYPVPASENLWVELFMNGNTSFTIYNMQGQVMDQQVLSDVGLTTVRLRINNLPSGIYMLGINFNNNIRMYKFMVN